MARAHVRLEKRIRFSFFASACKNDKHSGQSDDNQVAAIQKELSHMSDRLASTASTLEDVTGQLEAQTH